MATSLASADILTRIRWSFTKTKTGNLSTPTEAMSYQKTHTLTDGTGANKAQVPIVDQRTLTTGASETLDLKAILSAFGTAALTKIKALRIELVTATPGYTLKLKAGASNGFSACFSDPSDELVIQAGGALQLEASDACSAPVFLERLPDEPADAVAVYSRGGAAPDTLVGLERRGVQLIVRSGATDPRTGFETAAAIYNELHGLVPNGPLVAGGSWVQQVMAGQSGPVAIGRDAKGRFEWSLNFTVWVWNPDRRSS